MKLIVGLGNPGALYQDTRHNAGKRLIEYVAHHERLSFAKKKTFQASTTLSFPWEGNAVALAYPEVFMNLSGNAVLALVEHFAVDWKKNLLVVVDDIALPFGRLRLRPGGSDGGHNGLKSVHEALGSTDYPRLRLGIGNPSSFKNLRKTGLKTARDLEEYVLSSFNAEEKKSLPLFLDKGLRACRLWATVPIERAMNAINPEPARS